MTGWLSDRLSPVKSETQRWIEFASAIEEFWESESDPGIDFLHSLRSVFSAGPEGRALILRHMGDYFFEDNLPDDNIPMSVMWRMNELFQKKSVIPLENSLRRVGSSAKWEPLYALESDPYEDPFFFTGAESRKMIQLDGSWTVSSPTKKKIWPRRYMTSRGVLLADLNTISDYGGLGIARHRAEMLRPAHIVIDGFRYSGVAESGYSPSGQPRLDGTWKVEAGTEVRIMAYPTSHSDILSKVENVGVEVMFGHDVDTLNVAAIQPPIYTDYEDRIEFVGILRNNECFGHSIGAAGILVDEVIYVPFKFCPKIKTTEDSYAIKFILRFR